jgi:hypothetical protein
MNSSEESNSSDEDPHSSDEKPRSLEEEPLYYTEDHDVSYDVRYYDYRYSVFEVECSACSKWSKCSEHSLYDDPAHYEDDPEQTVCSLYDHRFHHEYSDEECEILFSALDSRDDDTLYVYCNTCKYYMIIESSCRYDYYRYKSISIDRFLYMYLRYLLHRDTALGLKTHVNIKDKRLHSYFIYLIEHCTHSIKKLGLFLRKQGLNVPLPRSVKNAENILLVEEMLKKVKHTDDNDGIIDSVLPFPTEGGHLALFYIIASYAYEEEYFQFQIFNELCCGVDTSSGFPRLYRLLDIISEYAGKQTKW